MGSIFSIQNRMFFEVGQNCQFHFLIRRMGKCSIEVDFIVILIQYKLLITYLIWERQIEPFCFHLEARSSLKVCIELELDNKDFH